MNQSLYSSIQGILIAMVATIAAYFDSTIAYLFALLLAFAFNIVAGFRADEVKIKIIRIFPPKIFQNFHGNKFKDSLMELFLITFITYFLKLMVDLMGQVNRSAYLVQVLIAIAIYYYVRNALRNLVFVYPRIKFIRIVYYLLAFKYRELMGANVADLIDIAEKEMDNINLK